MSAFADLVLGLNLFMTIDGLTRLIIKEVTELSPSTVTTEINKSVPCFCLFSGILSKGFVLLTWLLITFLCNSPALFHYKMNALALRKTNLALGLVLFIFLRLTISKNIKGQSLDFYIPQLLREAGFQSCFNQMVLIEARFLWAFFVFFSLTFREILMFDKVLSLDMYFDGCSRIGK